MDGLFRDLANTVPSDVKAIVVFMLLFAIDPAHAQVVRCQDGVFRTASDCPGARQAAPAITTEAPTRTAPVSRADAEAWANIESLRRQCEAAAPPRRETTSTSTIAAGIVAPLAIALCGKYERALKERQRYEAIRAEDPAAAARELSAQKAARDERRRNRPVITNCTRWAADRVTCISQ